MGTCPWVVSSPSRLASVPEVRGALEGKVSYSTEEGMGALKGLSKSRLDYICIFNGQLWL